jgi:hypothetical protein
LAASFPLGSNATVVQEYKQGLSGWTSVLRAIMPDSGAYVAESDMLEPQWRESFWGSKYDTLLAVKNEVDPVGVLTCYHCVGDTSA